MTAAEERMLDLIRRNVGGCREELGEPSYEKCWRPAEYVLWGKLIPSEGLGPRCYDHAQRYVSGSGLHSRANYALVHLGDLARDLATGAGVPTPGSLLAEFHTRPGMEDQVRPSIPEVPWGIGWRMTFIKEDAAEAEDVIGVADALGNLVYVAYGTAWRCGIDLDRVVEEIHRSNMTRTAAPGDGKAIKEPGYRPPNLREVLGL